MKIIKGLNGNCVTIYDRRTVTEIPSHKFFLWLAENDLLEEGVKIDLRGYVVFLQSNIGFFRNGENFKSKLLVKVYTFRAMWDFLTGEVAGLFIDQPIDELILQYMEEQGLDTATLAERREEDIIDDQINDLIEGKHE